MRRPLVRLRRPRGAVEVAWACVVGVAVLVLAARVVPHATAVLLDVWPVVLALAVLAGAAAAWHTTRSIAAGRAAAQRLAVLRVTLAELDAGDDRAFEEALRSLLLRDGWGARRVGGRGDQAADVIGEHARLGRLVVQAKHTTVGGKVGVRVMYEVNGTAGPVHRARHAVVVTNGTFTRDARDWGDQHGVHWVDRDRLRRWAENGVTLHELLGLPARPSRFGRAA
ncbi:restriction endonuclease [Streptomyces griseoincarnatus]|uniref:restriction endonuclease n=1 Tax=unclassified Streptomyces TaxID=2593676 RepID=UPI0006545404|nr:MULTISPECIES: restriction endonuclease [unclassified Streptomyces]MBQ0969907.1 restriction endonuclease [Streptomyces sp. RK31]WPW22142.1 restriction endonuclease [Streptomyces griseoincarnatus]